MKKLRFLVPSLLAAGFVPHEVEALAPPNPEPTADPNPSAFDTFRLQHDYILAGHRSHSSHSSHRSHRSSSGGGYSPSRASPAPSTSRNVTSTPSRSVLPSPEASVPKVLPGSTDKFKEIARQVQTALYTYGYYSGAIDGLVGPGTKAALAKFQEDWNLKITGTITPETLDALKISAR